ncbi:MAG TPA: hypothetical protein VN417_07080 [Candidatus Cryosericum sp.]|nr:hypothetical protein [Candidatus Cryosericum sp.]
MFQTTPNRICTMFGRPQGKPVFGRALTFRSAGQASLQAFFPSTHLHRILQTTKRPFFLPETAKTVRQKRIPARGSGFADRRNRWGFVDKTH